MRNNINKHKILKVLFAKRKQVKNERHINSRDKYGLTENEILEKLGIKSFVFENSIPELLENKEIQKPNSEINDLYSITENIGITSLKEKKYIFKNRKIIIENLKDWTSIIVPVITTTISLYLVIIQNKSNKEIQTLRQSVIKQESTIKKLELLHNNKVVYDKK